jgi:hypothetical protein
MDGADWIPDEPFDSVEYLHGVGIRGAADGHRPVVLFVAGGALAAKTAVLGALSEGAHPLIPEDPVVVDPDQIRRMLPEWETLYRARDPSTAQAVRNETLHIAREIVEEADMQRRNMILIGIGAGAPGEFATAMRQFADSGYEVRALMVDSPVEIELERNDVRAAEEGLRFDPGAVEELSVTAIQRLFEWKDEPWIAQWELLSDNPGAPTNTETEAPMESARVYRNCDWCGTPIRYGNALVTIDRLVQQVDEAKVSVIESNSLLSLCAQCGNRLDAEELANVLRAGFSR